jgi:crotonobetainyl-CoA:carnitine CoA-transferase CaiB-like acyl-CoA transferase
VADLINDPFVTGREAIVHVEDRDLGSLAMHNIVPRLSETPGTFRYPAPRVGEHTRDILDELGRLPD